MLVALISAIDGLSLLYQRLQTKLHYGFVDILGPWLQYTANLCFSTANTPPITPVESCYLFATGLSLLIAGLSFFTGLSFSLRLFTALFPFVLFSDCRFSFRLISGLPFLPDCRFSLRHIAWLSFFLPDWRCFLRHIAGLSFFLPDCHCFLRLITAFPFVLLLTSF